MNAILCLLLLPAPVLLFFTQSLLAAPAFEQATVTGDASDRGLRDEARVESPDGKVAITFRLQADGVPAYEVAYLGKPLVLESRLGLLPGFLDGFAIEKISRRSHQGDWSPVCSERKTISDNYQELNVDLRQATGRLLCLSFRAYNEGAAFRYSLPKQADAEFNFAGERSEFRFPTETFGYEEHGTEGEYRRALIAEFRPECERPLTLEFADGRFASLGEADDENYPRMLLSPLPGTPGALVSALGGTTSNVARRGATNNPSACLHAGDSTPWRFLVVGERPGDLLERNGLVLNLNPPCALKDTSWIKPGKAMRDISLTTTNSEAIVDFAQTAGLQYVLFDWHWYGDDETYATGDATTVRAPNLDLPRVIRYGRQHNVGVILYVDRRQIRKQRDILFPLFEKWGVKGVKIGFVDVGPQVETAWMADTMRQAARYHLLLDIHDGYRPMGLSRTYPNLLTAEGVRGNEHMPTPEHNCTLPFTRFVAGCADYTVCYYTQRKQTTCGHQLAMGVICFSPLQSLFWYDRPDDYRGEPEIEFFRHLPTVWDDTRVIHGEIGKYATVARRAGGEWFIGTINAGESRTLQIPLVFLDKNRRYRAHLYSDDDSVGTRTKVGVSVREVDSQTVLESPLKFNGGQAVWIAPL
jgi:alpha-glucosidase